MTAAQSDPLRQITTPAEIPPDQPDQKTAAETKELKQRGLPAGARADLYYEKHTAALDERIVALNDHNDALQREIAALRCEIADGQRRAEELAVRCSRAELSDHFTSWLNLLGNLMTAGGGILVSIAGALP